MISPLLLTPLYFTSKKSLKGNSLTLLNSKRYLHLIFLKRYLFQDDLLVQQQIQAIESQGYD